MRREPLTLTFKVIYSLAISTVLTVPPSMVQPSWLESSLLGYIAQWAIVLVTLPGELIALIASHGTFEDMNFKFVAIGDFIVYFILAYLFIWVWDKRKARAEETS